MSETQPEPPAPIVQGDPVEIADGVHVIPDGRVPLVPNIGFVEGERSVLVVDTGMGPRAGAVVLEHARRIANGRPLILTLTHFHPEHGYGAQAFAGQATIVYNAAQRDELAAKGVPYAEMFKGFGPAVADALEGFELTLPDVVYDGPSAEIDLGGRIVRLLTWGLAHTGGDQVVHLPAEGIAFGGDLFETRMFPIVPWFPPDDTDVDGSRWIDVLGKVVDLGATTIVPGHGEITDATLVTDVRDYLAWVRDEAARLKGAGVSADDAVAEIEPAALERWSTWENPEWIGFAVRCFHDRA